jgi:hypothetical protein
MLYNKFVKFIKCPHLYKFKNIHSIKNYIQENQYVCAESFKDTIKDSKIHNSVGCYYCNGSGWIVWKSNNNNNLLDLSKQPNIILYTICSKCQ